MRVAGVIAGAVAMLVGYFSVETPLVGMGAAIGELVSINSIQVGTGAIISLLLTQAVLKAYPDIRFFKQQPLSTRSGAIVVILAAIMLAAVVVVYLNAGIST